MERTKLCHLMLFFLGLLRLASAVPEYGVGFSLALDYGRSPNLNGAWCDPLIRFYTSTTSLLCRFDNPWGERHTNPHAETLLPLLRALKISTESYIGHEITDAVVTVPGRRGETLASQWPAGHLAAVANHIGRLTFGAPYNPEQLVLTVDYSRAALTMTLFIDDIGSFETVRLTHSLNLGAGKLSLGDRALLRSELRQIMRTPIHGEYSHLSQINHVVLLGEHGNDSGLRKVLQQVLLEMDNEAVADTVSSTSSAMVDPLFAAAIGASFVCYNTLELEATGCLIDLSTPGELHQSSVTV
nr:hypothetical protein CFP56_73113 [Quercus suber]